MNQALLAKIAWRLFSNQDSLIPKVSQLNIVLIKIFWRLNLWLDVLGGGGVFFEVTICWLNGPNGLWVIGVASML